MKLRALGEQPRTACLYYEATQRRQSLFFAIPISHIFYLCYKINKSLKTNISTLKVFTRKAFFLTLNSRCNDTDCTKKYIS